MRWCYFDLQGQCGSQSVVWCGCSPTRATASMVGSRGGSVLLLLFCYCSTEHLAPIASFFLSKSSIIVAATSCAAQLRRQIFCPLPHTSSHLRHLLPLPSNCLPLQRTRPLVSWWTMRRRWWPSERQSTVLLLLPPRWRCVPPLPGTALVLPRGPSSPTPCLLSLCGAGSDCMPQNLATAGLKTLPLHASCAHSAAGMEAI